MSERLRLSPAAYAKRIFPVYWLLDASGSMGGGRIQSLNYAVQAMRASICEIAAANPSIRFMLRVMRIGDAAEWADERLTEITGYEYRDLEAGGFTAIGAAFRLLARHFEELEGAGEKLLPPAILLATDGRATDDADAALDLLLAERYAQSSTRMALAIGGRADRDLLNRFVGEGGKVMEALDNIRAKVLEQITFATTQAISTVLSGR